MLQLFFKAIRHKKEHTRHLPTGKVVSVRAFDYRDPRTAKLKPGRGKDTATEDLFNPEFSGDLYDPKAVRAARQAVSKPVKTPKLISAQQGPDIAVPDLFATLDNAEKISYSEGEASQSGEASNQPQGEEKTMDEQQLVAPANKVVADSKPKPNTNFEVSVCSRCHGSGKHSYNLMHGDRCYGCGGSGWKLTKRGAAAKDFWQKLKTIKVADLKVGDYVEYQDMTKKFALKVDGIEVDKLNPGRLTIWGTRNGSKYGYGVFENGDIIKVPATKAEAQALLDQAIQYQESLTSQGRPKSKKQTHSRKEEMKTAHAEAPPNA